MDSHKVSQAYLDYWRQYNQFSGKSTRYDFWSVVLVNGILYTIASLVSWILLMISVSVLVLVWQLIVGAFSLVTILPGLALSVRRLRDIGKNWQWLFLGIIPVVNVMLVYFFCLPSTKVTVKSRHPKRSREDSQKRQSDHSMRTKKRRSSQNGKTQRRHSSRVKQAKTKHEKGG